MYAISLTGRNVETAADGVNSQWSPGRSVRAGYLYARDSASEVAQIRRYLAELVRRALELTERARLIGRRPCDVLGAFAVATRDLGDASHSLAEPADLRFLHA